MHYIRKTVRFGSKTADRAFLPRMSNICKKKTVQFTLYREVCPAVPEGGLLHCPVHPPHPAHIQVRIYHVFTGLCSADDYPIYPVTVCGGKKVPFYPSPSLSLIWCTCSTSAFTVQMVQMTGCLTEQLLPGTDITGEENSCNPNSSLPGTF